MDKLKLGILFGGRSQEHEVSIMSARSIFHAVNPEKYQIVPYAISKNGCWLPPEKSMEILKNENIFEARCEEGNRIASSLKPFLNYELDVVFPVLHGPYGEDGRLQGMLEMLDIPYVGAGVMSSAIGMDKAIMKKIFDYHRFPQGAFMIINKYESGWELSALEKEITDIISWPCFIKPANMGSSIGITKVHSPSELDQGLEQAFKYDYKIIVEEFIEGREIECSVLGNKEFSASLPGEIKPEHEFYDYEAKYKDEATDLIIPARLNNERVEEIRSLAIDAFRAIDGRGLARVDFFISDSRGILINEINTLPGFTRYSMYPKLWEATGIKYDELIDRLIELGLAGHN